MPTIACLRGLSLDRCKRQHRKKTWHLRTLNTRMPMLHLSLRGGHARAVHFFARVDESVHASHADALGGQGRVETQCSRRRYPGPVWRNCTPALRLHAGVETLDRLLDSEEDGRAKKKAAARPQPC